MQPDLGIPPAALIALPLGRPSSLSRVNESVVGRRAVIAGIGGSALLLAAGCTSTTKTRTTLTVTAAPTQVADPMDGLIATTRLHLIRLNIAIGRDKADATLLKGLQKDRTAHLKALLVEQKRTDPQAVGTASATSLPTAGVAVPTDSQGILGVIRVDASDAQQKFIDNIGLVSRYRAALFGSIAACLATHRAVLG